MDRAQVTLSDSCTHMGVLNDASSVVGKNMHAGGLLTLFVVQVYKINLAIDALLSCTFLFVIIHFWNEDNYTKETVEIAIVGSVVLLMLVLAQLLKVSQRHLLQYMPYRNS